MNCACEGEPMDLVDLRNIMIRTPRTCCECGEVIPSWSRCERLIYRDMKTITAYTCECCLDDWKTIQDAGICRMYGGGSLEDQIYNYYDGSPKMG